jgi:hypothetical protein
MINNRLQVDTITKSDSMSVGAEMTDGLMTVSELANHLKTVRCPEATARRFLLLPDCWRTSISNKGNVVSARSRSSFEEGRYDSMIDSFISALKSTPEGETPHDTLAPTISHNDPHVLVL